MMVSSGRSSHSPHRQDTGISCGGQSIFEASRMVVPVYPIVRKPRVLVPGARYHVTARTNHQEMLFRPAATKQLFLSVVRRAKTKFAFRLENFCIMENHVHIIIQPLNGHSLSRILQWILGVFASAWNRSHQLTGHFWGARFFSKVIQNLSEYLQTFQYIDANPVTAGLAHRPVDWPFGASSYRNRMDSAWLDDPPDELVGLVR